MAFPGSAPGAVAALDFFRGEARAVVASPQGDSWQVLGAGKAPLEGIDASGAVVHVSDAAETVSAALSAAAASAGRDPEAVYYTLHDPRAAFRRFRASRSLSGEGQVRSSDVRAAFAAAARLAGGFEAANLYSTGLGFVIDDQDPVDNPVGVFGRKLEIEAGFLQIASETLALWRETMRRAYSPPAWAVSLAQAAVLGALESEPDRRRRLVVLERDGQTVICGVLGAAIESFAAAWNGAGPPAAEILTAGEDAERLAERLAAEKGIPARAARPAAAGLNTPEDVPTAGLLAVARERERMRLTARHGRGLAKQVRRHLAAFWSDYF